MKSEDSRDELIEDLPSEEETAVAEERWGDLCNERKWDETTQIIHLEGFIREEGLFPQFTAFAELCAKEEEEELEMFHKLDAVLQENSTANMVMSAEDNGDEDELVLSESVFPEESLSLDP
jgi:hypothetical protein